MTILRYVVIESVDRANQKKQKWGLRKFDEPNRTSDKKKRDGIGIYYKE